MMGFNAISAQSISSVPRAGNGPGPAPSGSLGASVPIFPSGGPISGGK